MTTLRDSVPTAVEVSERPHVRGKFIYAGDDKLYVRGVTYGTFRSGSDGVNFPTRDQVERDFEQMRANGINAVRTYTVPPLWLLDIAKWNGLYVMVGLPWEQHIAFLDSATHRGSVERRVLAGVNACAGHPAILCHVIGNEIPAPIVRWHGRGRIEHFLRALYETAKNEDPEALVTYVNYPTTEYLDLSFTDVACFNVYLERSEDLRAYLARLQNLAGERPLIMTEIGLDSRRNGEDKQAEVLNWQIRDSFAAGCAGTFVFAWTDEWYRSGYDILDWDFGLTGRDRQPKPALAAVRSAYAEVPFPSDLDWPRISVVVCSFNGGRTIRQCCEALLELEYTDFEVIVVDDGSTDGTASIAREFGFRVISTPNRGLSSARNTGLEAATGEIAAYIDDDAYPDAHWLTYLAATFVDGDYAGVGGPNIAPAGDGLIADCVANAPGGPAHVLLSDREAEHIPGCNMAFRKSALEAIGGFDPQFRAAGDDVDVCWRLQERGWHLGFSPAAVVWHHRRNSIRAYWKQQRGYGRAEALLEKKWPEKYNALGHLRWAGRLYARGLTKPLAAPKEHVRHGSWGRSLFQSLYQPAPGVFSSLPLMPEWFLLILALLVLTTFGLLWTPLLLALPILILAASAVIVQAVFSAWAAGVPGRPRSPALALRLRLGTALLHLLQPLARLVGRLSNGLSPLRLRTSGFLAPLPKARTVWSEQWRAPEQVLTSVRETARRRGAIILDGNEHEQWDLEVRGGALANARLLMAIEEHGAGRQFIRFRLWPKVAIGSIAVIGSLAILAILAVLDDAWTVSALLAVFAALFAIRAIQEAGSALATMNRALDSIEREGRS